MSRVELYALEQAAKHATDMGDVVFADRWAIEVAALDDTRAVVRNWDNVPNTRYLIRTQDSAIADGPTRFAVIGALCL